MSKRDKLRQKLRNNPKRAVKQDILTLLSQFGFVLDRVSGSHHIFILEHDDVSYRLVIPIHGQVIRAIYVEEAIELIDELFPEEE